MAIIERGEDLPPEGRRAIFELFVRAGRELRRRREHMGAHSLRAGYLNADGEFFIECGPDGRVTLHDDSERIDVTEIVDAGVDTAMRRAEGPLG